MKNKHECCYCGELTSYELCRDCYYEAKDGFIIKNEDGIWIRNIKKGNEYRFYDENKNYYLKQEILNEFEMRFFNIVRSTLSKKYAIIPQVNLQSIITTDSIKRNDELYRNVDFALFYAKDFTPFLIIELNGQQHYTNEYNKERDKSIKQICDRVQLPILTIDIKDLRKMKNSEIFNIMKKVISYLNPSFFKKLFKKQVDKMDLTWTKEYIKKTR
ncbi:MAG: DUF2726 domain-containing protein [Clostridia bacterium]|nr:DUF2726 domain-containing protein [Clostridia bacterium]MBR4002648.1 DUF2726 domain-containing protein [Clostridia bacterium]